MSAEKKTKGEQTREFILNRAIGLVAKEGLGATSFQKIADTCGLTQSAVMHHFKNKDDLVEAMIGQIVARNHELVRRSITIQMNAHERLVKHFEGNFKWAKKHREEASVIILLYYYGSFQPSFSKLYRHILSRAKRSIEEYLEAGLREGLYDFRQPTAQVAAQLHSYLLGMLINLIASQSIQSTSTAKWNRETEYFLEPLLLGEQG